MQEWQQRAAEKAKDYGQKADQYVRENTWMTIGIAALVGAVIGYLISSSRED